MRPGVTWIVVGAVLIVAVFAGLDALRSSGEEPPPAEASVTEAVTTTPEQEIEEMGNEWARLFGAGRTCNRFMHQPACERVACERIGGVAIANCAPLSSAVQRSFAGAVVEEVVIRGQWAAARFSNGETVRFAARTPSGRSWWIDRVGAGREFFE
jgi:hypothetical protein